MTSLQHGALLGPPALLKAALFSSEPNRQSGHFINHPQRAFPRLLCPLKLLNWRISSFKDPHGLCMLMRSARLLFRPAAALLENSLPRRPQSPADSSATSGVKAARPSRVGGRFARMNVQHRPEHLPLPVMSAISIFGGVLPPVWDAR